jgi:hypothetical protein
VWGGLMAKKSKRPKSDLQRARERIYRGLLRRNELMASDPTRARQRHAQLAAEYVRADPRLA